MVLSIRPRLRPVLLDGAMRSGGDDEACSAEWPPTLQVALYVTAAGLCAMVWHSVVWTLVTLVVQVYTGLFGRRDDLFWRELHTNLPVWLLAVATLVAVVAITGRRRRLAGAALCAVAAATILFPVENLRNNTGQVGDPVWAYVLANVALGALLVAALAYLVANRGFWGTTSSVGSWTQWLFEVGLPVAAVLLVTSFGGATLARVVGLSSYWSLSMVASPLVAGWLCRRQLALGRSPRIWMIGLTLLLSATLPMVAYTAYGVSAGRPVGEPELDPTTTTVGVSVAVLLVIGCVVLLGVRTERRATRSEADV